MISTSERRNKIIMAIDDQAETLLLIQGFVESAGFSFVGARRGREAVTLTARMVPRLILLDIQMPNIDGFQTCRLLRANPALRIVPIAFLTALKTSEDVTAGLSAGGNDFIVKPFDPDKLIERIEYWTTRRIS
ncbi:MAG TPA: response regulator [Aliidongia sp.]|uniref:response regulator n=1 Tax=Aliidongia sp. TaxID=1914230 RepID=UPI002DDDB5AA|nr:response regulator [Aliidongia sp.]HEV2674844.1 response regulator [Aliidongia sp.]